MAVTYKNVDNLTGEDSVVTGGAVGSEEIATSEETMKKYVSDYVDDYIRIVENDTIYVGNVKTKPVIDETLYLSVADESSSSDSSSSL